MNVALRLSLVSVALVLTMTSSLSFGAVDLARFCRLVHAISMPKGYTMKVVSKFPPEVSEWLSATLTKLNVTTHVDIESSKKIFQELMPQSKREKKFEFLFFLMHRTGLYYKNTGEELIEEKDRHSFAITLEIINLFLGSAVKNDSILNRFLEDYKRDIDRVREIPRQEQRTVGGRILFDPLLEIERDSYYNTMRNWNSEIPANGSQ